MDAKRISYDDTTGSWPLMLLTRKSTTFATSVCDVEKYAVLNDDGNGTIPLIELTCKSEILAIILLNVDAKRISYDDINGSRPLMLLTVSAVTSPFVAVRMPVFVKIDESVVACTMDVEIKVVDVIVTLMSRA